MPDYPCPNFKQSHPLYVASVSLNYETGDVILVRSGLVVGWESTEPDRSEMLPHVLFTHAHGSRGAASGTPVESPFTVLARHESNSRWFFAPTQSAALAQARQYLLADPFCTRLSVCTTP
ncbi:hypothetical protein SLUN_12995 [Streptomyces lunaelactis]|uniref:Uncharacterized protein n=1 Tax=Streptomyces lunaelactis TaxID=1535768 RepID=A0A2R4T1G4_9ACTN|nr:hypothetical protein [Streptomyces lunaelactis]AVZ72973.1 hypothetical protein SLUN_12995 [Streptomyces lunaelactis]NUK87127.1 hypothetical protein [Streptomyces lunaelactis]